MSVIDDLRKLLQDLVTPDLRALAADLKSHREETTRRFDELDRRIDRMGTQMQDSVTRIADLLRLDKRITLLEDRQEQKRLPEKQ